jgi:hypothetical protein
VIVHGPAAPGPLSERVVSAVARAAGALGSCQDEPAVRARVGALVAAPLDLYERHANWPSHFTAGGPPVELSLKLSGTGEVALRCVADLTDYRHGAERNRSRYLDATLDVARDAGVAAAEVEALCRIHLDGLPELWHAPVVHGLGYAGGGWSRGCVYFRTGWLKREQFARRSPRVAGALDDVARRHGSPTSGAVEVMGYDFVPGAPVRWKAYTWLPVASSSTFSDVAGHHPDLEPARTVYERMAADAGCGDRRQRLMLQVTGSAAAEHQRLFFFSAAWGGDDRSATRALLDAMTAALGPDLEPLAVLTRVAREHGLRLTVPLIAVGAEDGRPSVTVYVWPRAAVLEDAPAAAFAVPATSAASGPAALDSEAAAGRGIAFLFGARDADGCWSQGDPTGAVTTSVAYLLLTGTHERRDLSGVCRWLAATYRPGAGWGGANGAGADAETTAAALSILARTGHALPADAEEVLLRVHAQADPAQPRVAATVLLALLETCPALVEPVLGILFLLVGAQQSDGSWPSPDEATEAMTVWQVAHALRRYEASRLAKTVLGVRSSLAASRAVGRSLARLRSMAVAREPRELAAWLGGWACVAGDARDPLAARAVAMLCELQRPDGSWPAEPRPDMSSRGACLVATAAAVGALQSVRAADREAA